MHASQKSRVKVDVSIFSKSSSSPRHPLLFEEPERRIETTPVCVCKRNLSCTCCMLIAAAWWTAVASCSSNAPLLQLIPDVWMMAFCRCPRVSSRGLGLWIWLWSVFVFLYVQYSTRFVTILSPPFYFQLCKFIFGWGWKLGTTKSTCLNRFDVRKPFGWEYDNFKPWHKSAIFECISWPNRSSFHECTLSVIASYTQPGLVLTLSRGSVYYVQSKTNGRGFCWYTVIDRGFVSSDPSVC